MKDPLVLSALAFMAFVCGISIGIAVLVNKKVQASNNNQEQNKSPTSVDTQSKLKTDSSI